MNPPYDCGRQLIRRHIIQNINLPIPKFQYASGQHSPYQPRCCERINTTGHLKFMYFVPCSMDLVLGFPKAEIIPYLVAQVPPLESSSPTIHDDDDILECASKVVMPVSFVLNIDLLTLWPTVPEYIINKRGLNSKCACTNTKNKTGYFVRPESSIRGGRISFTFNS
jgi:hypothetical protein